MPTAPRSRRSAACGKRSGKARAPTPCGKASSFGTPDRRRRCRLERIEQAMEKMSVRLGLKGLRSDAWPGRWCSARDRGTRREGTRSLIWSSSPGMQRIEHYEIAAYGTGRGARRSIGREGGRWFAPRNTRGGKADRSQAQLEVTRTAIAPEALAGDEEGDRERTSGRSGGRQSRLGNLVTADYGLGGCWDRRVPVGLAPSVW